MAQLRDKKSTNEQSINRVFHQGMSINTQNLIFFQFAVNCLSKLLRMTKKTPTASNVDEHISRLNHPLQDVVQALRKIITGSDQQVGEHIKWNSPAYYYNGPMGAFAAKTYERDLAVLHLHKPNQILMVFPTGAKIADSTGTLEGNYEDGRRMITIRNYQELEAKSHQIQSIIKNWLSQVI